MASSNRQTYGKVGDQALNPDSVKPETYNKMLDDAGVLFPYMILVVPVIRNTWHYENEDPDVQEFVGENLKEIQTQLLADLMTSLQFGWAGLELILEPDPELKWRWAQPLALSPMNTRIRTGPRGQYLGLAQNILGHGTNNVPAAKTILMTHWMRFDNLYGRSRFRSSFPYWFMDRQAYEHQAQQHERVSLPSLLGRYPIGETVVGVDPDTGEKVHANNRDLILDAGEAVANSSVTAIPHGEEWMLDPIFGRLAADKFNFNEDHVHLDKMKARGIFAPGADGNMDAGAYGKPKENAFWLSRVIEGQMSDVKAIVEKRMIEPLVELNFGSNAPRGEWRFQNIDDEEKGFLQKVFLQAMSDRVIDVPIDEKEVMSRFNVPVDPEKVRLGEIAGEEVMQEMVQTIDEENKGGSQEGQQEQESDKQQGGDQKGRQEVQPGGQEEVIRIRSKERQVKFQRPEVDEADSVARQLVREVESRVDREGSALLKRFERAESKMYDFIERLVTKGKLDDGRLANNKDAIARARKLFEGEARGIEATLAPKQRAAARRMIRLAMSHFRKHSRALRGRDPEGLPRSVNAVAFQVTSSQWGGWARDSLERAEESFRQNVKNRGREIERQFLQVVEDGVSFGRDPMLLAAEFLPESRFKRVAQQVKAAVGASIISKKLRGGASRAAAEKAARERVKASEDRAKKILARRGGKGKALFNRSNLNTTINSPLRGSYRNLWLAAAAAAGFVAYKHYLSDKDQKTGTSTRFEDRVGTLSFWNEIGEEVGSPNPLSFWGLHRGDSDYWYPLPNELSALIEVEQAEDEESR